MSSNPGISTDVDREFFEREFASFLPDRIFDAHTHLWRRDCVPWSVSRDEDLGYAQYTSAIADIPGGARRRLFSFRSSPLTTKRRWESLDPVELEF